MTDTNHIHWKGAIGYNDIISPIAFLHNEYVRRLYPPMKLTFWYENDPTVKYKTEDSETQKEWIDYIWRNMDKSDCPSWEENLHLEVKHGKFPFAPSSSRFPHVNYSDDPIPYHNTRFIKNSWQEPSVKSNEHATICIGTPLQNKVPHAGTGKDYKDPFPELWETMIEDYEDMGFTIEQIHYSTPIAEACEKIANSYMTISYHGGAAFLARWVGAPLLVYTKDRKWSRKMFPTASVSSSPVFSGIERVRQESIRNIRDTKIYMEKKYLIFHEKQDAPV